MGQTGSFVGRHYFQQQMSAEAMGGGYLPVQARQLRGTATATLRHANGSEALRDYARPFLNKAVALYLGFVGAGAVLVGAAAR